MSTTSRSLAALPALACALAALLLPPGAGAAPWIVITEIHYDPGDERLEFVELHHPEPPRADLSGWRLEGEVRFEFPRGTVALPGSFLVIARDPAALKEHHPHLERVFGPFEGRLDDSGGRLTLRNDAGARMAEARYGRGDGWTPIPSGTGHSLTLRDVTFDPLEPGSWAPSALRGGTPGEGDRLPQAGSEAKPLVRRGETWRFLRGHAPPPRAWKEPSFDDRVWESGPSGFGFADGDDETIIHDMRGRYLTLYTRKSFRAEPPRPGARLVLRVDYDDGFVAYLNGKEAARSNVGAPGVEPRFDEAAIAKHEAGSAEDFDLGLATEVLRTGENLLAVELHNESLTSSDASLIVELEARLIPPAPAAPAAGVLLSEALAARENGFIELHNRGEEDVDIGGFTLSDDPRDLAKVTISAGARVPAGGFRVVPAAELGSLFATGPPALVTLTRPDGRQVVDALRVPAAVRNGAGAAFGRPADATDETAVLDRPTPGEPNALERRRDIIINEILYHPPPPSGASRSADLELIELHNRGDGPLDIGGFRLAGGARHDFAPDTVIPAGGYLVIAKDPGAVRRSYSLPPDAVVGPFRGRLSNRGERIELRDARGNLADRVEYGDRRPWPRWADGLGSSLELIHPGLDNDIPAAWTASDESSGGSWQELEYEGEHRTLEGVPIDGLQLLLLGAGEALVDDIVLRRAAGPVLFAEAFERGASSAQAEGTHEESSLFREPGGAACFRIVATGPGNPEHNMVSFPAVTGLAPGERYRLSLRARWIRGTPLLLTRTGGGGLQRLHRLAATDAPGTPGRRNRAWTPAPPPVVATPRQSPAAPAAGEPVELSMRISSVRPLVSATIAWRRDGEESFRTTDLALSGGLWKGEVPATESGNVEFFIVATDDERRSGTFPAEAPWRTAVYAVGLLPSAALPSYALVVSQDEWRALARRPILSNSLSRGTFICGSRVFYDVGFRPRGSPFTRGLSGNWKVVFGAETLDGRRTLVLDRQGANERLVYWLLEELDAPSLRQRWVHLRIPGHESGVFEDVEEVGSELVARWFDGEAARGGDPAGGPDDGRDGPGRLYKVDDHIELSGGYRARVRGHIGWKGADPELYRWNFPPRLDAGQDLRPIVELNRFLDPAMTPDAAFGARADAVLDADEWLRVIAARNIMGDWDTLGLRAGKNAYLFLASSDGRWRLLPWDCDQSTRRYPPTSPLIWDDCNALRRLLAHPPFQRLYLGYIAYLAERRLEPAHLETILDEIAARGGGSTAGVRAFVEERRRWALSLIPEPPFRIERIERVEQGAADGDADADGVLRLTGTGPVIVQRIRIGDAEARCRPLDLARFAVELAAPPPGSAIVEALDLGGTKVASAAVTVPGAGGR